MADTSTLYRLIILQILDQASFPLSNTQITNFILDKDYTSYFKVQQVFLDLLGSDLIVAESTRSNTIYHITEDGRDTLNFFRSKISDEIKADIALFLDKNHNLLKEETSILSNYYLCKDGSYTVECQILEEQSSILNLTMHVATKEQADTICKNWKVEHIDVYTSLVDRLLQ